MLKPTSFARSDELFEELANDLDATDYAYRTALRAIIEDVRYWRFDADSGYDSALELLCNIEDRLLTLLD